MAVQPSTLGTTARTAGRRYPDRSSRRRTMEAVAFVGVWMMAGYLLHLSSDAYLLLGIPLTTAFRCSSDAVHCANCSLATRPDSGWTRKGSLWRPAWRWSRVLRGSCSDRQRLDPLRLVPRSHRRCLRGRVRAAERLDVAAVRSAALPIAIGASGMALVYGTMHNATRAPLSVTSALAAMAKYTALYFPATFLLEEVAFRGALDAHVHHDGDRRGWRSAVFVSALWGRGTSPSRTVCRCRYRWWSWSACMWCSGCPVACLAPLPQPGRTGPGPCRQRRRPQRLYAGPLERPSRGKPDLSSPWTSGAVPAFRGRQAEDGWVLFRWRPELLR